MSAFEPASLPAFEALVALELASVHEGIRVADAMLKEAPVRILTASPIPPGRFLVLLAGGVGEVESVYQRGLGESRDRIDQVFLAEAHAGILPALGPLPDGEAASAAPGALDGAAVDALGLWETESVSSSLHAADRMLKGAEVRLAQLHLARGIHGKSVGLVLGRQDMVEAALELARHCAQEHGRWVGATLLARPDPDLAARVLRVPWGVLGRSEIL